jgi:hypothetical protein
MSNSEIETARKAVASTRQDKTAKMVAHNDARIALESALSAVKSEGTPAARKALTACEQTAGYSSLELQGAAERHDKATADLARLERASKLTQHASRASSVGFEAYSGATSKAVQKIADARARLADAEAEAASIVRGFTTEAEAVRSEGAGLGAPLGPQIDYGRALASLVAKAEGKPAAAILTSVWAATAPTGVSPEAALAAVNAGTDMRRVQGLVAKLKDSTARAAVSARAVVLGGFESPRGDPTLRASARFSAAHAQAQSARAALAELMSGADASIPVDALSEKLSAVGADKAHAAFLALRMCAGLTMPGYPTAQELEAHRNTAAAKIIAELEAMALGEYVVRPSSGAQNVAHTIAPQGTAFAEVSL